MIAYKEVMVKHFEIEFINCDKCGKVITPDNTFEYQEIYRIHFWGGYGSVFGDGTEVDVFLSALFERIGGAVC